jgi:methylphosphotriester-DNA--protein-cysteine methyltransferase
VSCSRPTLPDVQKAIADGLVRGRRRLVDIAQILCTSESTVQRSLADCGTDFTTQRREVQVRIALEHLTAGRPAWVAAERAVLSPDHLCVVVREATGLTPLQIIRAAEISTTLDRWRQQGPPAFGSLLYRCQFEQWQKFDAHLLELFADLGPRHPLADWAKKTLLAAERPDFRTQPYRSERRRKAQRQAAQLQRLLESARADLSLPAAASSSPSSIFAEVLSGDGD